MTFRVTKDTRLVLPRELAVGRLVMIAFLSILLARQLASLTSLSSNDQLALLVALAVLTVSWIWFWWFLAAGPESMAQAIAVALVVGSATYIVVVNPAGVYPFYYAVIVAGSAFRWHVGIVLVSATTILGTATWAELTDRPLSFQVALVIALFGGGAITVRRYVAAQLALSQTQDELRRLAARQARLELARDLHDQLGQQLTVSVLQAELLVLDTTDAPPAIRDRANTLLQSSRMALQLMRQTVTDLRPPHLSAELEAAEMLLQAAGIKCSVDRKVATLNGSADTLLAWVVREGMTNVLRHSGARSCSLLLFHDSAEYILRIDDDGTGKGSSDPGSGLINMRHRVGSVGGTLEAGPGADGGFRLTARIPDRT